MLKNPLLNELLDQMPAGPLKLKALMLYTLLDNIDDITVNDIKIVMGSTDDAKDPEQ